jgi:uncharacterized protein with NRDE domain
MHTADGYHRFCNRDEKLTRPRASSPRIHDIDGARFIAPVDAACGGTWIATNEFGISFVLTNGANVIGEHHFSPDRRLRSRGLLVWEVVGARSGKVAAEQLTDRDLAPFPPSQPQSWSRGGT